VTVIVDTSVWSLALRRAKRVDDTTSRELGELIQEGRVVLMGVVRQELLSGIKLAAQFELLRAHLRAFPDLQLNEADHEEAASAFNRCRAKGIQGSNADFLICAAASRRDLAIYTTDRDFDQYAKLLDLTLHSPRQR
jgi:predicted nucleic acid-binding protein